MMEPLSTTPPLQLPLTGRDEELAIVRSLLESAAAGEGGMLVLTGGAGVGKSRLLQTAGSDAREAGWTVLSGRAYPVESGIPYAPVADAFNTFLRATSPETLRMLTRGSEAELGHVFPPLTPTMGAVQAGDAAELKARILWSFCQFLSRLSERAPILLLLDDLQWADASTLELIHFAARQIVRDRVAIVCSYNDTLGIENARLGDLVRSLTSVGAARFHRVEPLTHEDTEQLIRRTFEPPASAVREFTALLFGWTRGNPFFLEETLKALVDSGRLRTEGGVWTGWDIQTLDLPKSVRDAILGRLRGLSPSARALADLLSVVGMSTAYEPLRALADMQEQVFVAALEELRRLRLVLERLEGDSVVYDLSHPMVREALYAEMGHARRRLLHGQVADALEAYYGADAERHAGELAYHHVRSAADETPLKAIRYLAVAGRDALRKYSNREASDYLQAALDRWIARASDGREGQPAGQEPGVTEALLVEDLARARQRLGEFDVAIALWKRRLKLAEEEGDFLGVAAARRGLGLIDYWRAEYPNALDHFQAGLEAARRAEDDNRQVRLLLARGDCLMELGRPAEAHAEIEAALRIAEATARPDLLARVHLALLLFHTWSGPPELAHDHREQALRIAGELGDPGLLCAVHWGASVLSGLTGDAAGTSRHLDAATTLAEELRSPLHRLRVAEPMIEYLASIGEWSRALELGERTIDTARALGQRGSLARLLVWVGLLRIGRGELPAARALIDEAWELSGAGCLDRQPDVHTVVPAHLGRAAYHLAVGDFLAAIQICEAGLAIADRTGYTVWAVYRLLPTQAEAHLWLGDLDGAARVGARLRSDSERLGHVLGLAWADACDALLVWMRGDIESAIRSLSEAAERLEAVPAIHDAARLRRHIAARLRDRGRREEALRQLREIHEIFARLGAERELAKTREQIRELGARPPVREEARGIEGLSGREIEIATLAAQGKTNKAIAKALGISPRTVSTHLSNIFSKIEIASRSQLAEFVKQLDGRRG